MRESFCISVNAMFASSHIKLIVRYRYMINKARHSLLPVMSPRAPFPVSLDLSVIFCRTLFVRFGHDRAITDKAGTPERVLQDAP